MRKIIKELIFLIIGIFLYIFVFGKLFLDNQLISQSMFLIVTLLFYMYFMLTYKASYKLQIYISIWLDIVLKITCQYENSIIIKRIYVMLILLQILFIIKNICKRKNINENNTEYKILPELFKERKKDLEHLKKSLENKNIIGLNGDWGTGKSLIIEYLKKDEKDKYNFIEIDLLSLNQDNIKYYLMDEINKLLIENGIFSKYSRNLKDLFGTNSILKSIGDFFNVSSIGFNKSLEGLKLDLCNLDKKTLIVFEDIDRINNIDVIKSLFGISEKLSQNSKGKIKIIHQYYSKNLEEVSEEFNERFLEKYIEDNVNVTAIGLYTILEYLLEDNVKYKEKIETKDIINFINTEDIILIDDEISINLKSDYEEQNSIRRCERVLENTYNQIIISEKNHIKKNHDIIFNTVFVFNTIKYFYPSKYKEFISLDFISLDKDSILELFPIIIKEKKYLYSDFFDVNKKEIMKKYFLEENGKDEKLSDNLLNLSLVKKLNLDRYENYYSYINTCINNKDRDIVKEIYEEKNKILESREELNLINKIFNNLIFAGENENTEMEFCANKFIEDVLKNDKVNWNKNYNIFMNEIYKSKYTIFLMGIKASIQLFKGMYIVKPNEELWLKFLDFSRKEYFNGFDYEFISCINFVPMDNNMMNRKIGEIILELDIVGNLNKEKEFLKFLKNYYRSWVLNGVSSLEHILYIENDDFNKDYIVGVLKEHIEDLYIINANILKDDIALNIKVTKKLIDIIKQDDDIKVEHGFKFHSTINPVKNKDIEELLEIKENNKDEYEKKLKDYYIENKISKREVLELLKK